MNAINLGRVIVISDPAFQPPQSGNGAGALEFRTEPTTLSAAAAAASFTILQPSSLPRPGMVLSSVAQLVQVSPPSQTPEVRSVLLTYTDGPACWAAISLSPAFDGSIITTDEATEGQIGVQPAAFLSRTLSAYGQPDVQVPLRICLWEQGDLLVEIQGRGLSAEELVYLAEALA